MRKVFVRFFAVLFFAAPSHLFDIGAETLEVTFKERFKIVYKPTSSPILRIKFKDTESTPQQASGNEAKRIHNFDCISVAYMTGKDDSGKVAARIASTENLYAIMARKDYTEDLDPAQRVRPTSKLYGRTTDRNKEEKNLPALYRQAVVTDVDAEEFVGRTKGSADSVLVIKPGKPIHIDICSVDLVGFTEVYLRLEHSRSGDMGMLPGASPAASPGGGSKMDTSRRLLSPGAPFKVSTEWIHKLSPGLLDAQIASKTSNAPALVIRSTEDNENEVDEVGSFGEPEKLDHPDQSHSQSQENKSKINNHHSHSSNDLQIASVHDVGISTPNTESEEPYDIAVKLLFSSAVYANMSPDNVDSDGSASPTGNNAEHEITYCAFFIPVTGDLTREYALIAGIFEEGVRNYARGPLASDQESSTTGGDASSTSSRVQRLDASNTVLLGDESSGDVGREIDYAHDPSLPPCAEVGDDKTINIRGFRDAGVISLRATHRTGLSTIYQPVLITRGEVALFSAWETFLIILAYAIAVIFILCVIGGVITVLYLRRKRANGYRVAEEDFLDPGVEDLQALEGEELEDLGGEFEYDF